MKVFLGCASKKKIALFDNFLVAKDYNFIYSMLLKLIMRIMQ